MLDLNIWATLQGRAWKGSNSLNIDKIDETL